MKSFPVLAAFWIAVASSVSCFAVEAPSKPATSEPSDSNAAGIGAWTTDYPAALVESRKRKLPLFIQFTGSDWCGWCRKMERECLSKPEFLAAMKSRCVLVSVDFPHKTEQAPELKEQNKQLSGQFKKRGGFPAYYIVDGDAKTVQWSFGAHPKYGADLSLLIKDIDGFRAGCACVIEKVAASLPQEKADAYRKAAAPYAAKQREVAVWLDELHPDADVAKEKFNADLEELAKRKAAMDAVAPPQA